MISRALLRGKNSFRLRPSRVGSILQSIVAVPIYSLVLPVLFVIGHHYFMTYLVKLADHTGRLLAALGLNPMRERLM